MTIQQLLLGTAAAPSGIVTSGLVLHLDAGNAASYPGSGTAWTDLTGNGNNGTLTNGPTYSAANGGQIVFDGVNDYVAVAGSRTLLDCTFNLWIKRNGSQNSGTGLLFSGNNGGGTSGIRLDFNNKLAYHWNNFFFSWDSGLTLPDNQWAMATLCIEPTRARMYLNTTESTNTGTHTSSILILNAGVNGGFLQWFLNGSIAVARLYNRALSAAEIQQNFDANRVRFGL